MSAPSQTSSTRERQRRQSRERILRAAVRSFARAGFEAASLSRIAADAGVKKALVQYHFTTKDALWREAATRLWTERNARLKQFVANRGPAALARNLRPAFTALVEFTREQPEWLWFMFHEAQVDGPRRHWLIEHCLRDDYVLGQDFVRQCQEQGLIRPAPSLHLLHLITGALTYNLLVAPQTLEATGTDLAGPEAIARQVDLLLEMLAP
ncbi:TetR/AcrR family transcriptional regulator [Parahaliea mediterranea]|uniref:Helix-turn-helix transcriptional regulator n=1 Tax=Parahaliea mediterranea TaxID=651086 RepID=A0A939INF4_9GAMM|nr:TetR/AcrR family transcriptional regulator [Parahaliea mediterranea]MBN7798002.1 helix-turn-helix transcriptional regulator [Parahaliea mediterranea]